MALQNKVNAAKEVLGDTRSRVVVVILTIIVIVVLGVAYLKFKRSQLPPAGLGSAMSSVPNIRSIPGMGQPTREYAKLQEQQNAELAEEAASKGTSAMPTVVRTTYLDTGVSADLSKQSGAASVAGCGVEELKRARDSGVTATELHCRGCSLAALKAAGYGAGELLVAGFSARELKDADFSASELKDAGFGVEELAAADFSAKELAAAGYTIGELRKAKFSTVDLQAAGFDTSSLINCKPENLRAMRDKGTSVSELKKFGCTASELRAAGYTLAELRNAGFSAKELRDAGFSAEELKEAGFSAKDLRDAGFSAGEVFVAEFSTQDLKNAGFNPSDLKKAGLSAKELSDAGFTIDELKVAGYTSGDLIRAGVISGPTTTESSKSDSGSCSVDSLKKLRVSGAVSAVELKSRGCSASVLRDAGFTAEELSKANFTPDELQAAGYNVAKFETNESKAATPGVSLGYSSLQDRLGRMSASQMANMTDQETDDFLKQQQAMMMVQANQLFNAWTPIPTQAYVQGEEPKKAQEEGVQVSTKGAPQQPALTPKNADIYKAGSIILAVLDTEVNSDETSPVMATIVQGALKGSKVIGNFQRVDQKVLLQFTVLSIPKLDNSIAVSAVAIDPNTDKTALATSIDNHYMLRYGMMLASGFMSGLGQAVQNSGSQQTTSATAGTTTTMPALTTLQKTLVAVGTMAQQFGTTMAAKVNTPPTVKVSAGTSVGILLMADLAVPKSNQKIE